jgi:hypothetical protein
MIIEVIIHKGSKDDHKAIGKAFEGIIEMEVAMIGVEINISIKDDIEYKTVEVIEPKKEQ